jgi:hypothetical protein
MAALRRSAIVNSCKRHPIPLDIAILELRNEKPPVGSSVKSNSNDSSLLNSMDKWDEARVGFADREKDKEVHPGHVFKYGIAKVRRR